MWFPQRPVGPRRLVPISHFSGTKALLPPHVRKSYAVGTANLSNETKKAMMTHSKSSDPIQNLQITSQERRGPRMRARIPVLLLWDENGGERSEQAHTLTISWFGCAIQTSSPFRLGSSIQLYRDGKTVQARVVHCLRDHMTRLAKVGLEFVEDGRSFWDFPVQKQ